MALTLSTQTARLETLPRETMELNPVPTLLSYVYELIRQIMCHKSVKPPYSLFHDPQISTSLTPFLAGHSNLTAVLELSLTICDVESACHPSAPAPWQVVRARGARSGKRASEREIQCQAGGQKPAERCEATHLLQDLCIILDAHRILLDLSLAVVCGCSDSTMSSGYGLAGAQRRGQSGFSMDHALAPGLAMQLTCGTEHEHDRASRGSMPRPSKSTIYMGNMPGRRRTCAPPESLELPCTWHPTA